MVLQHPANAFPAATSMEVISIEDARFAVVRKGHDYWQSLRGTRRFPARQDIHARDIAAILPNMVLAKVLDHGDDFLLKIVGDEVGRAYRAPLNNRRMSEIAADLPNTAERWLAIYRRVAQTGVPVVVRAVVGLEAPEINFTQAETVCLPLGPADDDIDHIMTFGRRTVHTARFGP